MVGNVVSKTSGNSKHLNILCIYLFIYRNIFPCLDERVRFVIYEDVCCKDLQMAFPVPVLYADAFGSDEAT